MGRTMTREESVLRQMLEELKEIKEIVKAEAENEQARREAQFELFAPHLKKVDGRWVNKDTE